MLINWQKSFGLKLVTSDTFHANIGIFTNICNGVGGCSCSRTGLLTRCAGVPDSLGAAVRQVRLQEVRHLHRHLRHPRRVGAAAAQVSR